MKLNGIKIIPAIDIIDGKCVRLIQGDYSKKKIYNNNPLDVALSFQEIGISRIHVVDLDGAKKKKVINLNILKKLTNNTSLIIDFGGGIQTDKDLELIFEAGAHIANIGSVSIKNSKLFNKWIKKYKNKILLGIDVKNENIMIDAWTNNTNISIWDFLKKESFKYINEFYCTDISKDGVLSGPSIKLYKKIIKKFPNIKLIASGGISNIKDLKKLEDIGCSGAIIGKAIYENKIKLKELKNIIS